jgi:hypothetical protein
MNKHLSTLKKHGLLSFGREAAVFDLLKYITDAKLKENKNKTIISLKKKSKKMSLIVTKKTVRTKGDIKSFSKELEILKKDCLHEYAISVRSKKELLNTLSMGKFFKFVLTPVLLEIFNYFKLDLEKFCKILNSQKGKKGFLIFNIEKKVFAKCSKNNLNVLFDNASYSIKFKKIKTSPELLDKNYNIAEFQNNTRDAFFAGLSYTLKALSGEDLDYSFNGSFNALEQICKAILDSLYKYLMIENV